MNGVNSYYLSVTGLCTDGVSVWFVRPVSVSTDLFEGSLGSEEFVENADGDAKHGGQSQTPANDLAPPRVHVRIVVGQRLVVHQVEQEDALQRGGEEKKDSTTSTGSFQCQ